MTSRRTILSARHLYLAAVITAGSAVVLRSLVDLLNQPVVSTEDRAPDADVLTFRTATARVVVRPSGTEPKLKSYYEVRVPVGADEAIADARTRGLEELATLRDAHQRMI